MNTVAASMRSLHALGTRLVTETVIVVILRGLACMVFTCPLSPSDPSASGFGELNKGDKISN